MITLKSETLKQYYGLEPDDYELNFINYNIIVDNESEIEYQYLEEDIDNIMIETNNNFNLYFSDLDNFLKIKNNTSLFDKYNSNIYLRIKNKEEYEKYKKSDLKINLIFELKVLEEVMADDNPIVIQINHLNELSLEKLEDLEHKCNLKKIILGQICYIKNEFSYLLDIMSKMYGIDVHNQLELEKNNKITHDIYTIEEYKKIYKIIKEKIRENETDDSVTTLKNIFYYFANKIYYANDGVEKTDINNQNLINPLFNNKAVCEGYSKLIEQICSLLDSECICVSGGNNKVDGGHIWNQVKINGEWYNLDLTHEAYAIHSGENVDMFLVSDDKLNYTCSSPFHHECRENYYDNIKII